MIPTVRSMATLLICLLCLLALIVSCSDDNSGDSSSNEKKNEDAGGNFHDWGFVCNPGQERECLCNGIDAGLQQCSDEGFSWASCQCYDSCQSNDDCYTDQICNDDGSCGACTTSNQCDDGEQCLKGYCLQTDIPVWELTITEDDWEALQDMPKELVPCGLTAEGVNYDEGCKVRFRGVSSLFFPKRSFRIEFPEDFPHPGYVRKINLRSEYNDPSFLRNHLGYETFRHLSTIPTPRTRFVRLTLNGEDYGLFLELERISGKFLESRSRDRDSAMYEADPSPEFFEDSATAFLPLPNDSTYKQAWSKQEGDMADYSDLESFIEETIWPDYLDWREDSDNGTARIREKLDWDSYIDYLAVMAVIQSNDHIKKNFYFSWQDFGKDDFRWEFYPWDLDLTFGCLYDSDNDDTICDSFRVDAAYKRGVIDGSIAPGYPVHGFFNLLINQVLTDEQLYGLFTHRVCNMLEGDYWQLELPDYIDAIAESIAPQVATDPNDMNESLNDFDSAVDELLWFLEGRKEFLQSALGCE